MKPFSEIGELVEQKVISLQTGPFGSQLHSYDYIENGVPVVPTEGIQGGRLDHSVLPKISAEKASELSRHKLLVGDVLFARRGAQATGKTARVRDNEAGFICGTGAIRARIHGEAVLNRDFFAWFLTTPDTVAWIREQAIGATMPNLNPGIIKRIEVPLFPLSEQREIASILGALDDKIELNRKTAATLEEMARALYRSWFVDFDPVHAKASGRTPSHMDATTAALFPDSFGEDGLPEAWEWHTFEDLYTVLETGRRPKGGVSEISKGVPSIGAESIKRVGVFDYGKTKFVPRDYFEGMKKGKLADGDVLVYKDGGKPGELRPAVSYVSEGFPFSEACINEHVFRVRVKEELGQHIAYLALSEEHCMWQMRELATGVAQPGLNQSAMKALATILPDDPVLLTAFTKLVQPLLDGCNEKAVESQTLATLRDALLPRLMSGELRVGAAHEQVEEVV